MFLLRNTTKNFILANFLFINLPPTFSKCTDRNCSAENKYRIKVFNLSKYIEGKDNSNLNLFNNQIQSINNSSLELILINDGIRLDHFLRS